MWSLARPSAAAVITATTGRVTVIGGHRVCLNIRNNAHFYVPVPSMVDTNAFLKARYNSGCCLWWCRCLFCGFKGPVLYPFSDPGFHLGGGASYYSSTEKEPKKHRTENITFSQCLETKLVLCCTSCMCLWWQKQTPDWDFCHKAGKVSVNLLTFQWADFLTSVL